MKHEYAFDIRLNAAVRVKAENREMAERTLRECFQCADANFGAWPDGSPILAEASLDEDAPICYEVDGDTDHPEAD